MEISIAGQFIEHGLRRLTGINHAQNLILPLKMPGQLVPGQFPCPAECDPSKGVPILRGQGAQLCRGQIWDKFTKQRAQSRLGGSTQHGGGPIVGCQLRHGPHAGTEIGKGQHLRFIENDNALRQIVQLSALRGLAGEQGLEKMHCCGHDHRYVPRLGGSDQFQRVRRELACFVRVK